MKKSVFLTGLLAAFSAVFPAKAEDVSLEQVVLRGLDKVTGRISTMTVNVGEKAQFGALDIYVRVCFAHPPEETPENAAYLDIVENKLRRPVPNRWFWKIKSKPNPSSLKSKSYWTNPRKTSKNPSIPKKRIHRRTALLIRTRNRMLPF